MSKLSLAATLAPGSARGQPQPVRFVDMHSHLGFRPKSSVRKAMAKGPMFIAVDKITPDASLLQRLRGRLTISRPALPGELRRNFERAMKRRLELLEREGLPWIGSVEDLDRALEVTGPHLVIGVEGAEFLDGEAAYLERIRALGLVHLQLVHYYVPSPIGDIATEPATHKGLTAFGKDLVRACNRLGMLVDVAHCSAQGIEHALEVSNRPIIYSHGHVSASMPHPGQDVVAARAIHEPLARRIAGKGGVLGLWPLASQFVDLERYADELVTMARRLGPDHVGIGTDMFGLPGSVIPSYAEFARLPLLLSQRGFGETDTAAILGGNYIRVLRQALQAPAR